MFEKERADATRVVEEFLSQAELKKGDLVVVKNKKLEIFSNFSLKF